MIRDYFFSLSMLSKAIVVHVLLIKEQTAKLLKDLIFVDKVVFLSI